MYKTGGEEMVLCPYNRCHIVKKLRIQKHIVKCKKNYPEIKLTTCVYNYSHKLKPDDLLQHYEICPHKIRLDGALYEPCDFTDFNSVKNDEFTVGFPDLSAKSRSLPESLLSQMDDQQLDLSSSDSESINFQPKSEYRQFSDSEDEKSNDRQYHLEPLPLPKTVSKAFVCIKQEQKKAELSENSKRKGFGRGKNFLLHSSSDESKSEDQLLPEVKYDADEKQKTSWSSKNLKSICSQSVSSSMFDDGTTLKSIAISLDEDTVDDSFLFNALDKYVKI